MKPNKPALQENTIILPDTLKVCPYMIFNFFYHTSIFYIFSMLCFSSTLLGQNCLPSDSDSCQLVQLYQLTNGANWTHPQWDLAEPMCHWTGVECVTVNDVQHVKSIFLVNKNLVGDITNLNLVLPELQHLYLDNNQLSGNVPDFSIEALPKLKTLTLEANQLTGTIPNFNLPTLEILALGENNLSGTIPSFDHLSTLFYLALNSNQLVGSIPSFSSPVLTGLFVQDNFLTGDLPDFGNNLEELWLQDNRFTFHHLSPIISHTIYNTESNNNNFVYAPQDSIGQMRTKYITITHSEDRQDTLMLHVGGDHYQLTEAVQGQVDFEGASDIINLENLDSSHDSLYHITITDEDFPLLTLHHRPIRLSVIGLNSWQTYYIANQVIVKFPTNTPETIRQHLRNSFGADLDRLYINETTILELWSFSNPHLIDPSTGRLNINGTPSRIKKRSRVNNIVSVEASLNYQYNPLSPSSEHMDLATLASYSHPPQIDTIRVAIIDSGIDTTLIGFQENTQLSIEEADGYVDIGHFVAPNAPFGDASGIGTHLASILSHGLSENIHLQLLPLQIINENGTGYLFDALCALYLAYDNSADIINFNWSQQTEYNALLNAVLQESHLDNHLILIPAGDEALNTSDVPSYPTNFDVPNAIVVQAADEIVGGLAPFSNYSPDSIDVAVHGVNVLGYDITTDRNSTVDWVAKSSTAISTAILAKKAIYEAVVNDIHGQELKTHLLGDVVEDAMFVNDNILGAYIPVSIVALPIIQIDLTASWIASSQQVLLEWICLQNEELSHFEVERAAKDKIFKSIQTIQTHPETNNTQYERIDESISLEEEVYYYRLKLVDKNGNYDYSEISSLLIDRQNQVLVYPNPTSDFLTVQALETPIEENILKVYTPLGEQVGEYFIKNIDSVNIDVSDWNSGIYTFAMYLNGKTTYFKIVVL